MGNLRNRATRNVFVQTVLLCVMIVGLAPYGSWGNPSPGGEQPRRRPNILLAISDDQSGMHAGAHGDQAVRTPAFDRVAKEGVRFDFAYCAAPSCAPSRSAILTGQEIWRLEEGGVLIGFLPNKFPVFPMLLEQSGYQIGSTGKTWGPGELKAGGWKSSPTGKAYNRHQIDPHRHGLSVTDYAANFADFFQQRDKQRPFFFWYGSTEPHQPYQRDAGRQAGRRLQDARLPLCLPDAPETRGEILDYYMEIEHFDQQLARMIRLLDEQGELENTLIIVTSDHGNPLPRAKANLYDVGVRVPMAMRWSAGIPGGRVVRDFISLTDIAPTLLEIAGANVPQQVTGRSLRSLLESDKQGRVETDRDSIVTAFERHTICRRGGVGYPMRSIRTYNYSYIRNYEPDRWPAGDPDFWSHAQGFFGDVDRGVSKTYMVQNQAKPGVSRLFQLAFGRRPAEELYDLKKDPHELNNLASDPSLGEIKQELTKEMQDYLKRTGDPRMEGKHPWDSYPYFHPISKDERWKNLGIEPGEKGPKGQ